MVRTETGSLQYGVEYPADSGQLHYDFALRLPTVADNIQALETHGSGSMLRPVGMPKASSATMLTVGRTRPPPMIQRPLMRLASSALWVRG